VRLCARLWRGPIARRRLEPRKARRGDSPQPRAVALPGWRPRTNSCDVADWKSLGEVLARVRAVEGRIDGSFHGAGYAKPTRFEQTRREIMDRTVQPKLSGHAGLDGPYAKRSAALVRWLRFAQRALGR